MVPPAFALGTGDAFPREPGLSNACRHWCRVALRFAVRQLLDMASGLFSTAQDQALHQVRDAEPERVTNTRLAGITHEAPFRLCPARGAPKRIRNYPINY